MSSTTVERPVTGEYKELTELVKEAETLKPQQQEKLTLFIRGYVTAAAAINEREKATI